VDRIGLPNPQKTRPAWNATAAAVASVWPLDDLDDDPNTDPYCYACGAPVGIFHGHGDGWHH
jgi:hypothetical protein